jgi:hypothetical protein
VLSLLDNGGLKTLNKCELTMVVSAAARGIKMFAPGADALQESTMRPLIRRTRQNWNVSVSNMAYGGVVVCRSVW